MNANKFIESIDFPVFFYAGVGTWKRQREEWESLA